MLPLLVFTGERINYHGRPLVPVRRYEKTLTLKHWTPESKLARYAHSISHRPCYLPHYLSPLISQARLFIHGGRSSVFGIVYYITVGALAPLGRNETQSLRGWICIFSWYKTHLPTASSLRVNCLLVLDTSSLLQRQSQYSILFDLWQVVNE